MFELGTSFERDRYEICLVFLVICEQRKSELRMTWARTFWDNNLSFCPTKNSSKKFDHKWGRAGNEL